jgi:hypothetical protein
MPEKEPGSGSLRDALERQDKSLQESQEKSVAERVETAKRILADLKQAIAAVSDMKEAYILSVDEIRKLDKLITDSSGFEDIVLSEIDSGGITDQRLEHFDASVTEIYDEAKEIIGNAESKVATVSGGSDGVEAKHDEPSEIPADENETEQVETVPEVETKDEVGETLEEWQTVFTGISDEEIKKYAQVEKAKEDLKKAIEQLEILQKRSSPNKGGEWTNQYTDIANRAQAAILVIKQSREHGKKAEVVASTAEEAPTPEIEQMEYDEVVVGIKEGLNRIFGKVEKNDKISNFHTILRSINDTLGRLEAFNMLDDSVDKTTTMRRLESLNQDIDRLASGWKPKERDKWATEVSKVLYRIENTLIIVLPNPSQEVISAEEFADITATDEQRAEVAEARFQNRDETVAYLNEKLDLSLELDSINSDESKKILREQAQKLGIAFAGGVDGEYMAKSISQSLRFKNGLNQDQSSELNKIPVVDDSLVEPDESVVIDDDEKELVDTPEAGQVLNTETEIARMDDEGGGQEQGRVVNETTEQVSAPETIADSVFPGIEKLDKEQLSKFVMGNIYDIGQILSSKLILNESRDNFLSKLSPQDSEDVQSFIETSQEEREQMTQERLNKISGLLLEVLSAEPAEAETDTEVTPEEDEVVEESTEEDQLLDKAKELIAEYDKSTVSFLRRRLQITRDEAVELHSKLVEQGDITE